MTTNSSISQWEDRIRAKDKLSEWLSSENKLFALSVECTQEIEDISRWFLEVTTHNTTVVKITLSSDTEVLKHGVLEDIAIDIGKHRFPLFYQELNRIEALKDSVTVSQSVGNHAKIKKDAQFQAIEQTINIHLNQDEISLHYLGESKINSLLSEFVSDMRNLIDMDQFLFIFRFVGKGLSEISTDFQVWFQNYFCHKIQKIYEIKTCVLSQCRLTKFHIADDQFCDMLFHLEYDEIVGATCNRIEHNDEFCNGVIDPDTNTIDYKTFVRKWRARLKKEAMKING